jgi:hypothetical protein
MTTTYYGNDVPRKVSESEKQSILGIYKCGKLITKILPMIHIVM